MPPSPAARASPSTSVAADRAVGVGGGIGQHLEGERLQGVAGEDGGRLVEGAVHRRLAAAEVVVVHRGQVVMDQRIAMQKLDRRAGAQRPVARAPEQAGGLDGEERAQPLAAAEHRVPHRGHEARRPRQLACPGVVREQPLEQRFGRRGLVRQRRREGGNGHRGPGLAARPLPAGGISGTKVGKSVTRGLKGGTAGLHKGAGQAAKVGGGPASVPRSQRADRFP